MKKHLGILFSLAVFVINNSACTDFADVFGARPEAASAAVLRVDGTYYIVLEGDNMPSVAEKYDISAYQLAMANGLETDDELIVGQKLLIPQVPKEKDTGVLVAKEKKKGRAKGDPEAAAAKSGKAKGGDDADKSKHAKEAREPKDSKPQKETETKEKKESSEYVWPVDGIVTSLMGPRRGRSHDGIDVSAPFKAPIVAIKNGTVIFSGKMSGYGNLVIVKHSGNIFSAYAHMSEIKVEKGKKVKQGELLGLVGRTGRASATHLHFEIRSKTQPVDPMKYLPRKDPKQIKNLTDIEE